jgi:hypothetical protein
LEKVIVLGKPSEDPEIRVMASFFNSTFYVILKNYLKAETVGEDTHRREEIPINKYRENVGRKG